MKHGQKPKALITTSTYRLVDTPAGAVIERKDGRDAMGAQVWRRVQLPLSGSDYDAIVKVRDFVFELTAALRTREKRRRRRSRG